MACEKCTRVNWINLQHALTVIGVAIREDEGAGRSGNHYPEKLALITGRLRVFYYISISRSHAADILPALEIRRSLNPVSYSCVCSPAHVDPTVSEPDFSKSKLRDNYWSDLKAEPLDTIRWERSLDGFILSIIEPKVSCCCGGLNGNPSLKIVSC